jgi:DNA topoisomerase-1
VGIFEKPVRRIERKPSGVRRMAERSRKESKQVQVLEGVRKASGHRLKQLIHNGVLIPDAYVPQGFTITFRGTPLELTPLQEEMAVKLAQKFGTPYAEDPTFCSNFMKDFAKALGINEKITVADFDWTPITRWIEAERARKANMSKEEKKQLAAARKKLREERKERYGWATVDGIRMEVGNYAVEPPSVFMGRGKTPPRGHWKPAVTTRDVTLNLSPDAPTPPGEWAGREWRPDELWVAKWTDKLAGKVKYIWFHDATPMKQERVQEKFDLAHELESKIDKVRAHIAEGLRSEDVRTRKVATVAYLIDVFKIRVGDEKETESGTVGATSLQGKHIALHDSPHRVKLHFLGKDWVLFERELEVSEEAFRNLKEFTAEGGRIFSGITTEAVREFLSEAMPRLSPKVFRTFSATHLFRQELGNAKVTGESTDAEKKMALTEANAAVAQLLNHQKAIPKKWQETYKKRLEMLKSLKGKKGKSIAKRKLGLQFRIAQMRLGKNWNLGTSLRNYIDPRVSVEFCKKVNYDWKAYYPKSLITKFAWADQA